jgi:uncharacterized DUF497 family protein
MGGASFEWDLNKDGENQSKHGVSFAEAQLAFLDPKRVIAEDLTHGAAEKRHYCFGVVGEGIMTVRFTYAKENEFMSAKIKYTNEPLEKMKVVPDFLPKPADLVLNEEGVKVTLALSKRSVEFFKREAERNGTQYQRMIRRLLDAYAQHHSRPLTARSKGRA